MILSCQNRRYWQNRLSSSAAICVPGPSAGAFAFATMHLSMGVAVVWLGDVMGLDGNEMACARRLKRRLKMRLDLARAMEASNRYGEIKSSDFAIPNDGQN